MTERITFAIPFEGFYHTDLDEDLDEHILWLNGLTQDDEEAEDLLRTVDYEATQDQVARHYAKEWLEVRHLKSGRVETYEPPRPMQPRPILKVSAESAELKAQFANITTCHGLPITEVNWNNLPEIAWEDAFAALESEVVEECEVPHIIRETLKDDGHMNPIFKE